MKRILPLLLLAAVLLLPGSSLLAKVPETPAKPTLPGLFGQGELLVASPAIEDPRFRHAVILLVRHGPSGAFGLIINKPAGEIPLAELLRRFHIQGEGGQARVRLHYGGPVQPELGFVLHTAEKGLAPQQPLTPRYGLSPFPEVLRAMGRGHRPRHALFILGYAGWSPGQLEGEMSRGDWDTAPADEDILFGPDPAAKWERARERRTRTL